MKEKRLAKAVGELRWPFRLAVALIISAGSCVAIWWFAKHGWPDWPPRILGRLQVYLFMAAPFGIFAAIVVAFYRDKFK